MALTDTEKGEIISYINDSFDGESICDDGDEDIVVFTFDAQGEQPRIGTDTVLELLKRGFFLLYGIINDDRKFEMAITNGEGYRY
jgi:hypothetical protein